MAALLLLLLLACAGKGGDSACATHDPPLGWDNFASGFFAENCTGCHHALLPEAERGGAPLGVDFDTYAGVSAWAAEIEARVLPDDATMPPSGALTAEQRESLAEWLGCGLEP